MRKEREIEYRCEECDKNLTDRPHVRIVLGCTSGWMIPPFIGGRAAAELAAKNPETHFCKPECFTLFFNRKLHAIRPDTARNARRARVSPAVQLVLEEARAERSRVPGQGHDGARADARWEEGERAVGPDTDMRLGARSGPIPGRGRHEEGRQPMDRAQQNRGLEGDREDVPTHILAARPSVSHWVVRPLIALGSAVKGVLP